MDIYQDFTFKDVLWGALSILSKGTPLCVALILNYFPIIVASGFAGHLNNMEAYNSHSLYMSIESIIGSISFAYAVGSVYQGYISRAFASQDIKAVQLTFQRTLCMSAVVFFVAQVPLMIDSGLILRLLGQSRTESLNASNMALITLPGYLTAFISEVMYRTMFAHGEIWPAIVSGATITLSALCIQFLSILLLHWGLVGIALANCVSLIVGTVTFGIIFLAHDFVHDMQLLRPLKEALDEWREMGTSYAASVVLQMALRSINEFSLIIGGLIGGVELATANGVRRYTLIFTIFGMAYSTPCIAGIGKAIGARSCATLYVYTAATFVFFIIFLTIATSANILLRYPLAYLISNDPQVVEMTANITFLLAIYDFLKLLLSYTFHALFRGSGSVVFPTALTLIVEYLIGIPLGMYLSLFVGLGIAGFYWAMNACFIIEIILNIFYISFYLWPEIISKINQSQIETNTKKIENEEVALQTKLNKDSDMEENKPILETEQPKSISNDTIYIRLIVIGFISILLIIMAIVAKIVFINL